MIPKTDEVRINFITEENVENNEDGQNIIKEVNLALNLTSNNNHNNHNHESNKELNPEIIIKSKLYEPTDKEVYAYDIGLFLDKNSNGYILKDDIPTLTYNDTVVFSPTMFKLKLKRFYDNNAMARKVDKEIIELTNFMKQIVQLKSLDLDTLIKIRFDIYKKRFDCICMSTKLIKLFLFIRFKMARTILIKVLNKKLEADGRDYIGAILNLIFACLECSNYTSSLILIIAIYNIHNERGMDEEYTILMTLRIFAIISFYMIAYSSGIQLLINKGCYEPSQYRSYSIIKKIMLNLYFTFLGPLFFIFLTIFDIFLKLMIAIFTFFIFKNEHYYYVAGKLEGLIHKLGLHNNDYEGILEQNAIAKLLFQNFLLLISDTLILTGNLQVPGLLETSFQALMISYITTIVNIFKTINILYTKARFFREELLAYSFITMKAKFNWIPFINNIRNGSAADKIIDYYFIRCPLPIITQMTGIAQNFTFDFTDIAINRIREEIAYLNINRLPDDPLLRISIGRCIGRISLPIIGHLISVLVNDNIDIDFFGADWNACIDLSFRKKRIKWDKKSEDKWKALTPVGESIISLIIRTEKVDHFELEPLLIALIKKGTDLNLIDSRNFTPLTLSVKYKKIRSINHLLTGAGILLNQTDLRANEYPLDIALENAFAYAQNELPEKDLQIIKLLLSNGADPSKDVYCFGKKINIFHKALKYLLNTDPKKMPIKFPILSIFVEFGCKTKQNNENITLFELIAYMRAHDYVDYSLILEQVIDNNIKLYELTDNSGNTFMHLYFRNLNDNSKFDSLRSFYPDEVFKYRELLETLNNINETPISHCLKYSIDLIKLLEFDNKVPNGDQIIYYIRNYDEILAQNLVPYVSNFLLQEDDGPLTYFEELFFDETYDIDLIKQEIKKNLNDQDKNLDSIQTNGKNINANQVTKAGSKHRKRPEVKRQKFENLLAKVVDLDPLIKYQSVALKKLKARYNLTIDLSKELQQDPFEAEYKYFQKIDESLINNTKKTGLMTLKHTKPLPEEVDILLISKIDYSSLKKVENSSITKKKKLENRMKVFSMDIWVNLILQIISFADFITDIFLINELFHYGNRGWICIAVLSIFIGYLASYTPFLSLFISRKSIDFDKKVKNKECNRQISSKIQIEENLKQENEVILSKEKKKKLTIEEINENDTNELKLMEIINTSLLLDASQIMSKIELPPFQDTIQKVNPNEDITRLNNEDDIQKIRAEKKSINSKKNFSELMKWCYGLIFLSPLCIFYFLFLDIFYLIVEIIILNIRISLRILGFIDYAYSIEKKFKPKIYNKIFRMNYMDIKGIKKLRSISQLIFETIPMIILQLDIAFSVSQSQHNYNISIQILALCMISGLAHLILELGVLYSEAKALSTSFNYYLTICLNARFNWVPYTETILDDILRNNKNNFHCNSKLSPLSIYSSEQANQKIQNDIEEGSFINMEQRLPSISTPASLLIKKFEFDKTMMNESNKVYNYSEMPYSCLQKIYLEYKFYQSTIDILGNCFTNMPLAKNKFQLTIINLGDTCASVPIAAMLTLLKLGYGKVQIIANWNRIIENNFPIPPTSQPLDSDSEYILISLTQTKCIDGLRPFLEKVKHLDCNVISTKNDKSLAMIAIENKAYDILNLLIRYNIDIFQSNIKNKSMLMNALENPDESNFCLLVNLLSHPKVALSYNRKLQVIQTIKLLYSKGRKAEAFLLTDLLGGIDIHINGIKLIELINVQFNEDIFFPEKVFLVFDEKNPNDHNPILNLTNMNDERGNSPRIFDLNDDDSNQLFKLEILQNFKGLRLALPGLLQLIKNNKIYDVVQERLLIDYKQFNQLYNILNKNQLPANFNEFDLEYLDNIVECFGLDNKLFFDYYYLTGILREELEIKINLTTNEIKQKFVHELVDVPVSKHDDIFENLCQIKMPNKAVALKSIEFDCDLLFNQSDYYSFDLSVETQCDCFYETMFSYVSQQKRIKMKFDGIENKLNLFEMPIRGTKFNLYLTHTDASAIIKLNGYITITAYVAFGFGK